MNEYQHKLILSHNIVIGYVWTELNLMLFELEGQNSAKEV